MRVGISLTSGHSVKDPREGARWMIERAAAARQAGLDSLFVGDHHSTPSPYYQNVPILGRLLAEWGEAPAGCLFLLPLWNPVLVAEQVGTLAAVTRGRFIFQCGLGYDEARDQAAFYLERCKAHGRTPRAVAIRRDVYVGESAADADELKAKVLAAGYRGIPAPALVAGSVERVVERFAELATLGYTDVIVRHISSDHSKVLGSLARLRRVREALASV